MSLLLRTQIEAVALPGKWVLLRLNLRILVGHKFLEFEWKYELVLPFYLLSWWKLSKELSESELYNEFNDSIDAICD